MSLMFADFVGHVRGHDADHPDSRAGGRYYEAYVLRLAVPPIPLPFWGQPVGLILAYDALAVNEIVKALRLL